MSDLKIRLLCPPRVELAGQAVILQRQKAVGLLVYLAVERSNHSRDALAALLWPESSKKNARAAVRRTLSYLNKQLGKGWLRLEGGLVSLNWEEDILLDVAHFQDLLTAAEIQDKNNEPFSEEAIGLLTEAAEIYNNDFLAGFTLPDAPAFDEWQYFQAESLRQQQGQVLAQLVQYHTGMQHLEQAIGYARQRLTLDPLQEEVHRQLMAFYSWSGQRHAALRQYQVCVDLLAEELQVEPEEPTKAIYELVRTDKLPPLSTSMPADFSQMVALSALQDVEVDRHLERESYEIGSEEHTLKPTETHFNNLPVSVTTFVGREDEIRQVSDLLKNKPDCRLMTLFGPGGIGKTRLAIEAAKQVQDGFENGMSFVPLAAVSYPDQILPAIAKSLAFTPDSEDKISSDDEQLLYYLNTRKLLLLLDNFEQLLSEGRRQDTTAIIHHILQSAPHVKLLITSRERLNMQAEHLLPLSGLHYPMTIENDVANYAAINFLQQCIQRRQPNFQIPPNDVAHVITICRLLDGMPLGLEMVAVWVDLLPLREIASEIKNNLDFLAADFSDWPDRHRSMRAVFDASWARLSPLEKDLFAQLSLFRGSFTRAAASAVAGNSKEQRSMLSLLSSLVRKSLLHYNQMTDRYVIHELLRQYGEEKLTDERAPIRHSHYYCNWLAGLENALKGEQQKATLTAIKLDMDNIRVAWNWAVNAKDSFVLQEAAFSLGTYFYRKGLYREGSTFFTRADSKLRQEVEVSQHLGRVRFIYWRAKFEPIMMVKEELLQLALTLCQDITQNSNMATDHAAILLNLGIIAHEQGEHQSAIHYFERSLNQYRLVGDLWGEANVLFEQGVNSWGRGKYDEATQRYKQSLAIREELQDYIGMAVALEGLAGTAMFAKERKQAIAYTQESLTIYRKLEDPVGVAVLNAELGHKNWHRDLTGLDLIEESLNIFANLGTRRHLAHWTVILAMYKADVDIEAAKKLAENGLAQCQLIGYRRGEAIAHGVLSRVAWLEQKYSRAQKLAFMYLQMTEDMALPLERSDALVWLAWINLAKGKPELAANLVCQVLQIHNLWQEACLNLAAILVAHLVPKQSEFAWQIIGYGEMQYSRHLGSVSQQMIQRFLPETMHKIPQAEVAILKKKGQLLDEKALFSDLLSLLQTKSLR